MPSRGRRQPHPAENLALGAAVTTGEIVEDGPENGGENGEKNGHTSITENSGEYCDRKAPADRGGIGGGTPP